MANADVGMSMGDMMMIKAEEEGGDSVTGHRSRVILHLQSVPQGTSDDITDTSTTVLAVETNQAAEDSNTDDEVEYGYPITCGDSRAVLLYKKFVCPGINVKCVKFNGQLISPKHFVQLAGKSTLKDWKRAIRLGGVMLRKMMDSGQIDFYQHDNVCTNSCRSTKFDLLINSSRLPSTASMTTPTSPLPGGGGQMLLMEEKSEDSGGPIMDPRSTHMLPIPAEANGEMKREHDEATDESLSFWQGLSELGLVGEVVSSIRTELLALLRGVEQRGEQALLHHTDAAVLSTLTHMFGLLDSVRQVLDLQRSRASHSEHQLHDRLDVLECQLDNQRRQDPWRAHPSSPFPIIVPLEATPYSRHHPHHKRPRPRLQRSSSYSAASSSSYCASSSAGGNSSGPPFSVLSPITFSHMGPSMSVPGLPISTLAQLPTGSQLYHSTSPVPMSGHGGYRSKAEGLGLGLEISPASGLSLPGAAHLRHHATGHAIEVRSPSSSGMEERMELESEEDRERPYREVHEEERERERPETREVQEEEEEEEERGREMPEREVDEQVGVEVREEKEDRRQSEEEDMAVGRGEEAAAEEVQRGDAVEEEKERRQVEEEKERRQVEEQEEKGRGESRGGGGGRSHKPASRKKTHKRH
ncbi:glucocorticoid modulatory element-binding protein 1-like [Engraulis encrasicolus]|uniref:glucocorticoid modulatory element-binding protein 1-like n=1 Tax=Engraulis encrasicolus TaxID=184585 RepID=UPI002FD66EBF